jgi:P27 family predicted phage terminase small subunit
VNPEPPDWLSPAAREVWGRTVAELEAAGRPVDADNLVVYCNAVVSHAEASKIIDRTNVLLQGDSGRLVRNPANAVAREAAATISRLSRQMGLTGPPVAPRAPQRRYRNAKATDATIGALRATGRLEKVDSAAVALTRTLAEALDVVDPESYPAQLASLARAQLATLHVLRGGANDDTGSASLDELLAALGDASQP